LLFFNIQSPWHFLVPILLMCGPNETGKIVLLFSFVCPRFFWKVSLDVFTRDKQHTKKKENSIGLIARLPIGDR